MLSRRRFLEGSVAASIAAATPACSRPAPWKKSAYRKPSSSRVAILEAPRYEMPLTNIVVDGIKLCGLSVRGKTVVLKPNLVEYDPASVINTHPSLIAAAIEAFRELGAREVVVAEGPGHRRDTEYILKASGVLQVLRDHRARYVDLNDDEVVPVTLESAFTSLGQLYFAKTALDTDLLVSMPKLKTHHWAGVTLAMKNLFGVVPGAIYGWPKNTLHWAGINQSILDINSTLPVRQFAIVDGIVGMEGDGPIRGDAKSCGVVIFGEDLVAVDATAARVMGIDPTKVKYVAEADRFLGNVAREKVLQIGEAIEAVHQDFRVIDSFRDLKNITG